MKLPAWANWNLERIRDEQAQPDDEIRHLPQMHLLLQAEHGLSRASQRDDQQDFEGKIPEEGEKESGVIFGKYTLAIHGEGGFWLSVKEGETGREAGGVRVSEADMEKAIDCLFRNRIQKETLLDA